MAGAPAHSPWTKSAPPVPAESPQINSSLVGRNRARWTIGTIASVVAHVTMFGGALLYARLTPPRTVAQAPIMARLVRLGKPRPDDLLPRLNRPTRDQVSSKHAKPEPAKPPQDAPNAVAIPQKEPKPTPDEPDEAESPVKQHQKEIKEAMERQKRIADALAKLGAPTDGPTSDKGEDAPGDEKGDVQGDADKAAEGDRYVALVVAALRRNFIVPTAISDKEPLFLNVKLRIFVGADGRITRHTIDESSGNLEYDHAVEATVNRTELPSPPADLARTYATNGIGFRFKP
jgi:TonB family protein